ncbi:MAG: hypothetical protein MJZ74_05570 [Muribaculaceae bacterium]|nr:hypothetical protein [Muribaculaceae bacterium]
MDDDAAAHQWGDGWRMPTLDEICDLYDTRYTVVEWVRENGVLGYRITSKTNNNSIFLPAAGYCDNSIIRQEDKGGYYWTKDLRTGNNTAAWSIDATSTKIEYGSHNRHCGLTIRPVRVAK